jgi:hypothetical protein
MAAEDVAKEYFRRMQAGEPVVQLFAEDGELIGLGSRVSGRKSIGEFYAQARRDSSPRPEVLTLFADGARVLAEAYIHLANGDRMHVVDRFEVEGDLIRSLTYFTAEYPAD